MIADFLTILRNGIMRSKSSVTSCYSKVRFNLASILKEEGFITDVFVEEEGGRKTIRVVLKYVDGESVIHEIKRVSKPSRRIYAGVDSIKPVIGGLGVSILTTSQGFITDKTAKQQRIGGELVCTVW